MRYIKIAIALMLLWFVFFGSIPNTININPLPNEVQEVQDLIKLEKPSEQILSQVLPVAKLVTSVEDRAKLALFNNEFASRVTKYTASAQQVNDLYVEAAKQFFEDKMKGKYENYSDGLKSLFRSITTDDNHVLTNEEKELIKNTMNGLAWALIEG